MKPSFPTQDEFNPTSKCVSQKKEYWIRFKTLDTGIPTQDESNPIINFFQLIYILPGQFKKASNFTKPPLYYCLLVPMKAIGLDPLNLQI